MRLRFVLPLLPLLLGACSRSTTSATALCILAAHVDGADYGQNVQVSADRVGPVFTRTVRQRGCDDVIISGEPAPERWRDGDSSFPANTPLHASLDHPTAEVLLAPMPDGSWLELRRIQPVD